MATGDPASLTIDSRELQRALKLMPERLHSGLARAFSRSAIEFEAAMDDRFNGTDSGPPDHKNTGNKIVNRTGALARSVRHKNTRGSKLEDLHTLIFIGDQTSGAYAGIQEFGGVIKGKPWLAIPLPDAKTASGVSRYPGGPSSIRNGEAGFPTWLRKTESGNLIIQGLPDFQGQESGSAQVLNLWLLRRSVKIPARLGFNKTFKAQQPRQTELINKAAQKAIVAATKGT